MHMINNKSTANMIYLYFSKAFDKVDHGILLYKLRDLGITGRLGLWFFYFLNNRQHYVRIPGGISQLHPVLSGVPQGPVFGPLLFLIMSIDIDKGISPNSVLQMTLGYTHVSMIFVAQSRFLVFEILYLLPESEILKLNLQEIKEIIQN